MTKRSRWITRRGSVSCYTFGMDLKSEVAGLLHQLGFELVGFTRPDPPLHLDTYLGWVDAGRHAGMAYLASPRALQRRANPAEILTDVRTIAVVGLRYSRPAQEPPPPQAGRVAAYAAGPDYHEVIPPRLEQAARLLQSRLDRPVAWRVYTDTGPILERDYAMAAGLGWIGKNTCLISPKHGSYFLLGELLLDVELEPDPPFLSDYCGSCRRCIEACPTGCIREDRTLESARCISYLTIENKGAIPAELRPQMGDWIFGCDVCQAVCPWNLRFAAPRGDPELDPSTQPPSEPLHGELQLSPQDFNRKFKRSPILRARRRGYLRNIAVVLGNRRDPAALSALCDCLLNEPEALVRAHAAWALGQFAAPRAVENLKKALENESDPDVVGEIRAALHFD